MGRITEARGVEAFDVLDELIEAFEPILADPEISGAMKDGANISVLSFARKIMRRHPDEVLRIIAVDDGVTVEEERGLLSAVAIPVKLMKLLGDPVVKELLFGSAAENGSAPGSSAASGKGNG